MSRHTAVLAGALLVLATTACGIEDLVPEKNDLAQGTAQEIFAAAKADIESLEAVHVSGSIHDDGKPGSFNLSVSRSGECTGRMTIDGIGFALLVADSRVFVRPDTEFFRRTGLTPAQASAAATQLGNRWFEDGSKKFGSLCDLEALFDVSEQGIRNLRKALPGKVTVTGETEIMGVATVGLSATGPQGIFSMAVAIEEPHHVVSLTAVNTGRTDGSLSFSDHDITVDTEVPRRADIVPHDQSPLES